MRNVKMFVLILLIGFLATTAHAQSEGDYQSRNGVIGNWTGATTWQMYSGGIWTDVPTFPSSADGIITIRSDAEISYDTAIVGAIDQLIVNGTLIILPGISFNTIDGAGNEVEVNGTFIHRGTAPVMAGTGVLNSGSVYVHNTTSSAGNMLNFFGTKATDSTWIYRGSNVLTPAIAMSGRSYGNLEFESSTGSWSGSWAGGSITTVNGNFLIGANVTITNTSTSINEMKGNYTVNGAMVFGSGTQNFSFKGLDNTMGGSGIVSFETATIAVGASYTLAAHVNVLNGFTFAVSGTLGCGGFTFTGDGNFNIAAGGTFKICNPNGINGNVLVTGSKIYSTSANYEFYGIADQITGAGFPIAVNNLTINTDFTVSLSNTLVVNGTLHFSKGCLALEDFSLLGSNSVTGAPEIIFNGTGLAIGVGNNIDAIITTLNPANLPATMNSLIVQTGVGNNFLLPNDVTTNVLSFVSGGLIFNHNTLSLAAKDISFHAPNNTTYINSLVVSKTDAPALASGGDQSISRLWNIAGLSSAPVDVTLYWPTPAADAGIVFTDNKGSLWNFTGGSWINTGLLDISTSLGIRSTTFVKTLGAKDINGDYTISGDGQTLPVELSSFSAALTAQNFVKLSWVSQSETGLLGYRVYRDEALNQATAVMITPVMVPATNTSSIASYSILDNEVTLGLTYYYWLESVDMGSTTLHGPISVFVEGEVPPVLPEATMMRNAYPNPFTMNGSTNIDVTIKQGESGTVTVYNIAGKAVKTFKVNEGLNTLSWNGLDNKGNACGSGIYFYRLSTPSLNQSKKLVIVK